MRQAWVDMRTFFQQPSLSLFGRHFFVSDQPANRDGGTASPAGFAVNVNRFAGFDVSLNEGDSRDHVLQTGVREVGDRQMQLLDVVLGILIDRADIFFASVDDAADIEFRHLRNISSERASADNDQWIDPVKPIADFENASQQHVPPQRW